jgi:hypothetical protein
LLQTLQAFRHPFVRVPCLMLKHVINQVSISFQDGTTVELSIVEHHPIFKCQVLAQHLKALDLHPNQKQFRIRLF